VKVLDLSRVVSGPSTGRFFADLGADVVKVEPPEGDVTRTWGSQRNGVPGFFLQQNAGKRGLCVDLRVEGAARVIIDLAANADILIENFRGGVMDRLGLGWPVLQAVNPRLVMLSISGFGQTGPEANRPAYASVIQAEAGWVARHSFADERRPTDTITSVADYNAGLHGAIAALAALHQAKVTGIGDHIDLAMIDSMMATDDYLHYALDDEPWTRLGGTYYQTADGNWTVVSGPTNHVFRQLRDAVKALGLTGLIDTSAKDASAEEKRISRHAAIDVWTRGLPDRAALVAVLERANLPWGALNQPEEATQSPTIAYRSSIAELEDAPGSTRRVIQMPYRFAASAAGAVVRSPHLGEHNTTVLREWAGYSSPQIEKLVNNGVLLGAKLDG
jgi:CoA:oxalate CoA-transferase